MHREFHVFNLFSPATFRVPAPPDVSAPLAGRTADQRRQAEAIAGSLPPLLVAAYRVAATVEQGLHGRRRTGIGEAFWQFRRYQAGDPVGRIDWRQSAKRQAVHIREDEWEAVQTVWLWRDRSASMAYRSRPDLPQKRDRAEMLLLALAILLARAGERFAVLGCASPLAPGRVNPVIVGRNGLERAALMLAADDDATSEAETSIPKTLGANGVPPPAPLPAHARVVLFGDFWLEPARLRERLAGFSARRVTGHLVQVVDPAELAPPFRGRTRVDGLENEPSLLVPRFEGTAEAYHRRLTEHHKALSDLARAAGWTFVRHTTDTSPALALLTLHELLTTSRGGR